MSCQADLCALNLRKSSATHRQRVAKVLVCVLCACERAPLALDVRLPNHVAYLSACAARASAAQGGQQKEAAVAHTLWAGSILCMHVYVRVRALHRVGLVVELEQMIVPHLHKSIEEKFKQPEDLFVQAASVIVIVMKCSTVRHSTVLQSTRTYFVTPKNDCLSRLTCSSMSSTDTAPAAPKIPSMPPSPTREEAQVELGLDTTRWCKWRSAPSMCAEWTLVLRDRSSTSGPPSSTYTCRQPAGSSTMGFVDDAAVWEWGRDCILCKSSFQCKAQKVHKQGKRQEALVQAKWRHTQRDKPSWQQHMDKGTEYVHITRMTGS
eukprot:1140266-Pelagomonas_calceolata.AAC.6